MASPDPDTKVKSDPTAAPPQKMVLMVRSADNSTPCPTLYLIRSPCPALPPTFPLFSSLRSPSPHPTATNQPLGELAFNVKENTPFSKIMSAYCKQKGIAVAKSVRFLTEEGLRCSADKTVGENEVCAEEEEGDDGKPVLMAYVSAVMEQLGGGGW